MASASRYASDGSSGRSRTSPLMSKYRVKTARESENCEERAIHLCRETERHKDQPYAEEQSEGDPEDSTDVKHGQDRDQQSEGPHDPIRPSAGPPARLEHDASPRKAAEVAGGQRQKRVSTGAHAETAESRVERNLLDRSTRGDRSEAVADLVEEYDEHLQRVDHGRPPEQPQEPEVEGE